MVSLVQQIAARLDAQLGPSSGPKVFDRVAVAAEALSANGELRGAVEAWVVGFDYDAAPPRNGTGPMRQLVSETVLVVLGFLYSGSVGADADPENVEAAVVTSLLGFVPDGRAIGLSLKASRLMNFDADKQLLFRQVVFETSRQLVAVS